MTIKESNKCKKYIKEIEHIQRYILDTNIKLTRLQHRFYEHRVNLLESYILKFLNTYNNYYE